MNSDELAQYIANGGTIDRCVGQLAYVYDAALGAMRLRIVDVEDDDEQSNT